MIRHKSYRILKKMISKVKQIEIRGFSLFCSVYRKITVFLRVKKFLDKTRSFNKMSLKVATNRSVRMKGQYKLHHEIKSCDVPVGDYQSHICNELDLCWFFDDWYCLVKREETLILLDHFICWVHLNVSVIFINAKKPVN